ncbi:hypothetical protein AHMF7605_18490 [Adhaeribacter arboris]|uniref:Histidine kinase n=1 Tax=Adhaeribacter arboris TaxID=2072846 RepID=A0A2T2YIL5_9BACT|nr:two-component regulator propeller domain-containing protein [Adhaeribacter arboris]PSR55353.1 hypothetical protein AHMF7605_18490 [Adhaeribacter arboris]
MGSCKHIIPLLLLLLFTPKAWGQPPEFTVTHYDETSGLPSNSINAKIQDSRGYIWLGTDDGLFRYDGYTFKLFKKPPGPNDAFAGTAVTQLAEDQDGRIWMGTTKDGLTCYDPTTGEYRNFPVKNIDRTAPLTRSITMLFVDNENNVWAGLYQKGLIQLNKATGKFTQYNVIADTNTFYTKEFREVNNLVNDMHEKEKGIYWLATRDGLYRFNSTTGDMQPVRAKPLQKNISRDDLFTSIADDKHGLWLGSWGGGLSYYDLETKQWNTYKYDLRRTNVATINIILDIKPKNENELWLASSDRGFGSFNKLTHQFTFFSNDANTNATLPGKFCLGLMLDKQNNIWLSHTNGLSKVKQTEKKFTYVPVKVNRSDNGPFYEISSMLEDKAGQYFFIGTSFADGLHVVDKHTGKTQILSFPVKPNEESILMVNDMVQDSKGIIWVLTRDYVYQYDLVTRQLISLPQPPGYINNQRSNAFTVLREDKKGNIWIASGRNGVFCYEPQTKTYQHFYSTPGNKKLLRSNVISGMALDKKGRIWVGGRGCFGYFDDSGKDFINLDQYGKPSASNYDNRVYTLYADKNGDIWAGTDAGLYHYDANQIVPVLKKNYNVATGLRGEIVAQVQEDIKGDIWCITNSAVCRISRQTGNITTFGKLDGINKLNSLYYQINSLFGFFLFQDNKMALLSSGGYYVFEPASIIVKKTVVPLAVTSFKMDEEEQLFEKAIASRQRIAVPAKANVISFEYAALDFDRPDKQQYAYRLVGFDKDWVKAGQRRYTSYANIPRGNYVFQVKATNTPDNWNTPVVSIPIRMEEPFYKTTWFLLAVALILAASVYVFFTYKLVKQQEILALETKAHILEKEKVLVLYESLKQQLNPHFLFNSLTSLSSLIRYDQKKAGVFLDGLSKMYRYILKSSDTETVALCEELKFVQTFINLQQTRFDQGLLVNINIADEYAYTKIAPVTLQNLIENAIKHNIIDADSPLIIDIYPENSYLIVRNNLQKKNFVETSNKQGLASLQSLYHYLSDKPLIITETGQFFFVKIPLL